MLLICRARCLLLCCPFVAAGSHAFAQRIPAQQPPDSVRQLQVPVALTLQPPAPPRSLVLLPPDAATAHYGFFCRQELKWDKALPVQLRFRVGSHEACDRLEGKRRE